MGKIIGIDLGTTNSAVAIIDGTTGKIIENLEGKRTTPSIIGYTDEGEVLVGETAKRQAVTNPTNTIYAAKRLIGRRFDDPEVEKMKANAPFKIIEGPNGDAWVEVQGEKKAPAEISAQVLMKLKEAAESYLGEEITEAVVTVPAYFNDAQRKATQDAGKIAGLNVKRIVNEPTAAALAAGVNLDEEKTIGVYDLGGGTFDVSILEIGDGAVEVLATNGDTFLGGEDFDNRIIDYIAEEFKNETGFDVREDKMALQRVKEAAEDAKKALSTTQTHSINIPFIGMNEKGPLNLLVDLSRSKLESLVEDLIEASIKPCLKALQDAGKDITEIDEWHPVGGQTRMPAVMEAIKKNLHTEEEYEKIKALEAEGKSTVGVSRIKGGINPDEIVAAGASIQGGILSGDVENVVLFDVTPLAIGIKVAGPDGGEPVFEELLSANSTIPAEKEEVFTTDTDGQTNVVIELAQGGRTLFKDNSFLGKFTLDGIIPAPAGTPKIAVKVNIDANGVMEVTAKDQGTGLEQKVTIEANGGLSDDEVEAMRKSAEDNKEADAKLKENIEIKEQAKVYVGEVTDIEQQEYYTKASEEARTAFQEVAAKLKTAYEEDNTDELKTAVKEFKTAKTELGKSFYDAQQKASNDDNKGDAPEADDTTPDTDEKPTPPKQGGGNGGPSV